MLALLMLASLHTYANNVSVNEAKAIANTFMKSHYSSAPGSFKAPSTADLQLAHAESSRKVAGSNVYYAFNIKGGGFIIVAGNDMATPILGYSDQGRIDFNNLPEGLQCLLDGYKEEIEYAQTHPNDVIRPLKQSLRNAAVVVEPMTRSTWGPEYPYNTQCPVFNGKNSKVGCAGVAMAQFLFFWQFPVSCPALPAYYASNAGDTVPAIPATSFDYDKMLLTFCYWDFDKQKTIQYEYTEEQVYEVAKLCRYVGQMAKMNYSPSKSGITEERKLNALKDFGFNSLAKSIKRASYTPERWNELLKTELDAGRPVMYAGFAVSQNGHGWIIDGYNNEDYFHMNMGWYGYNDGWYLISSIKFVNRFGNNRFYNGVHNMILNLEPPLFCEVNADGVLATINAEYLLLGKDLTAQASRVHIHTSYRTLEFTFSLIDNDGAILSTSDPVMVKRHTYDQYSDMTAALTLPAGLPAGRYKLQFEYRTQADDPATIVATSAGSLYVVGRFAKFDTPFTVNDVVFMIDEIIEGQADFFIGDVVDIIDSILNR